MKKQLTWTALALLCIGLSFACKKSKTAVAITEPAPVVTGGGTATTFTPPVFVSNPKNLNIVMFVPKDNPALTDYKTRLTTLLVHFQNWFHTEMLRYGYNKYMGLPKVDETGLVRFIEVPAAGNQTDYPYNSSVSASKIINEINAYKTAHPTEFSNSSHMLILLPNRTDGGDQPFYGWGKYCFAVDNASMSVNHIPNNSSNLLGGMLHELGHGLNLPHDHAKYASEEPTLGTSLMGSGNVTFSKGQATFLTPVDAAILNRNEVFQNPLPSEVPYESATASLDVLFNYNATNSSFNLTGTFASNKEVTDILVYMDPDLGGSDADYNAVTWRFNPSSATGFTGNIAFNELYYKANYPYDVRVKLLLKNGGTVSKTYAFSFLNGVPQVGANGSAKFYQNSNYAGYEVVLPVGEYTTADLISKGITNNDISSVNVGIGLKVILYDGDNFTGSSLELTSSSSFVSTFNDKTSSIKVIAL